MLSVPANPQVFLCTQPIDLRKSFDGLCAAVEAVFRCRVLDGHLFLFVNKRRDRLKALWWDRDGCAICYKRLSTGRFGWWSDGTSAQTLAAHELQVLLSAGDPRGVNSPAVWRPIGAVK